jgi:hypothetical protein
MGGLIDGEGNLSISKSTNKETGYINYHSVVSVANTSPILPLWSIKHFGGVYRGREREDQSDNVQFEWYLTGNQAQKFFLETIRPYVCFKKKQIDILLEYLDMFKKTNPGKREELYNSITACHHDFSVETDTLNPLSKEGKPYYAALLDGEGTISISEDKHGHFRPAVRVYNSNLSILKPLLNKWGGSIHENTPEFYSWYINKKSVIEQFLMVTTPYLLAKRKQAKVMLEFVRLSRKWNPVARKLLYDRIVYLNNLKVKIQSELTGDSKSELEGTLVS